MKSSRAALEDDLDLINREKLQKISELDVVVPLRLHQVNGMSCWIFSGDKTASSKSQQHITDDCLPAVKNTYSEKVQPAQSLQKQLISPFHQISKLLQNLYKSCLFFFN